MCTLFFMPAEQLWFSRYNDLEKFFPFPFYKKGRGGFAPPDTFNLKRFPLFRLIKTGGVVSTPAYLLYIGWRASSGPRPIVLFPKFIFPPPSGYFSTGRKSTQKCLFMCASGKKWFFQILCALRSAWKKPLFTFGSTRCDRAQRRSPPAHQWGKGE